jgi:hypothetical protein
MVRSKTILDIKKALRHVTQIQLAYMLMFHGLRRDIKRRNISGMSRKY